MGAAIRAAQWGGREKTGAPTRLFLGLVARALSAPPLALGIFPSSGCSFLPGRGVAPGGAGARRVPLAGSVSSAPPPSTARGGVVGRSGPFRAGRPVAGASRLPNPLWCGLVLGPSLFRGAGRCRSPLRRLWIAAQPVIEIFSSGGGARLLLRPWAGGAVLPRSFCPPPGPQWVTRLRCGGGGGGGRRPPPPVSAWPPVGTRPRQVWRVHARMQGALRGPRGRGPSAYTVYRARTQICGNSKCSTRIGNPGLAELRRGLDSRSKAGKTAQGPLPPALGWFRALPASLLALKTLPQIGQYRQYSRTGYRQEGHKGPKGMITIETSYSVRFIGHLPLTFPSSRGNILSKSVIPLWPAVPYHGVQGFNLLKTGFGLPPC